jgi:hypothetical protein
LLELIDGGGLSGTQEVCTETGSQAEWLMRTVKERVLGSQDNEGEGLEKYEDTARQPQFSS